MKLRLLATATILATCLPAVAADTSSNNFKAGDIMIRARALGVLPDTDSSMNIADKVKLTNSYVPEFDVSYFFTPNISAELIAAVTPHSVSTKGGADIPLGSNWYANLDVKKIFINTDAKFSDGAVRANVDINPWVVGVGVGYKF